MLTYHRGPIILLVAAVLSLALTFGACDDSSTSPGRDATLTLLLADAPGAGIAHAWVEITGIYLQGEAPGEAGRVDLLTESTGMIDLTTLADATLQLVQDVVVPPGTYAQLRLIIGDAVIETDDGKVYVKLGSSHPDGTPPNGFLQCPSCTETGIKINLPSGAVRLEDEAKILVLDFDVSQSYGLEAGLAGVWVMNPLINGSDFEASGTISGSVSLAQGVALPSCGGRPASLADFVPLATAGEIQKSGNVEADGSYKISFVEPGDYNLGYEPTVEFDNGESLDFTATHPAVVSVSSGASVEANFTINSASCSAS